MGTFDSHLLFKFQSEFGNDLVVFKTTSIELVRLGSVFPLDAYICFVPGCSAEQMTEIIDCLLVALRRVLCSLFFVIPCSCLSGLCFQDIVVLPAPQILTIDSWVCKYISSNVETACRGLR